MNNYRQSNGLARSGLDYNPKDGGLVLELGNFDNIIRENALDSKGAAYWPSLSSMFNNRSAKTDIVSANKGYPIIRYETNSTSNNNADESEMLVPSYQSLQSSVIARFTNMESAKVDNRVVSADTPSSQEKWAAMTAISYSLLLVVLTGLVATLFAQQSSVSSFVTESRRKSVSLISQGWVITSGDCKFWYDGACVPQNEGIPDQTTLGGIMDERERKAIGLFSSVNAPFLCLAASVISAAFSLCLLPNSDASARRLLKLLSMLVIVVFGVLFLFIQNTWSLPVNNLLLIEFLFMISLFFLVTYSVEKGSFVDIGRLIEMLLTNPLIAISVLSASGDDNANNLILVYGSLLLGFLVLLLNFTESVYGDSTPGLGGVVQVAYWLCMVPFIVQYSFRFHYMVVDATVSQPTWSVAALAFTFAAYVIKAIIITITSWYEEKKSDNIVDNDRSVGMVWFAVLDLVIKMAISLLLVIGFFIELQD